jgi:hypothetical protein
MSGEPEYETQSIDHLSIVAGISREIGLVEIVDAIMHSTTILLKEENHEKR